MMPGAHFLGTTDYQPLELKVNNQRALRLEPNTNGAPNVIGGFEGNQVGAGVYAATIAGGGGASAPHLVAGNGGLHLPHFRRAEGTVDQDRLLQIEFHRLYHCRFLRARPRDNTR